MLNTHMFSKCFVSYSSGMTVFVLMRIHRAVLAPRMLVLDVGQQETQIDAEAGSHSSHGDAWDQNQRYLHLVHLEQNQCSSMM